MAAPVPANNDYRFDSVPEVREGLRKVDYLADEGIAGLIRLQCYEGLDESKALYEWNYKKQLLRIQAQRVVEETAQNTTSWQDIEEDIFSEEFLLTRPLLEAI